MIGAVCSKVNRHALLSVVLFNSALLLAKNISTSSGFSVPILGVTIDDTPTAVVVVLALVWGNAWML